MVEIERQTVGIRCPRDSLCRPFDKGIQTEVGESPWAGTLVASFNTGKYTRPFWLESTLTFTKPHTLTAFRLLVPYPFSVYRTWQKPFVALSSTSAHFRTMLGILSRSMPRRKWISTVTTRTEVDISDFPDQ